MMKKTAKIFVILAMIVGLSSCGINHAWNVNLNQNVTQVQLGSKNFKVVGRVKGTAEVAYVLIFGGVKKKQLYNAAYADMLEKADLSSGARTLTNVVTEEQVGGVPPFYFKRTVTVSASIIEFTD